jgi:hypothetical protein
MLLICSFYVTFQTLIHVKALPSGENNLNRKPDVNFLLTVWLIPFAYLLPLYILNEQSFHSNGATLELKLT